jgi:ankyrin repeat protein
MIRYNANVNANVIEMTPFMYAAHFHQVEIIKLLQEARALINLKCKNGFTVAKYAELSNATKAITFLINLKSK